MCDPSGEPVSRPKQVFIPLYRARNWLHGGFYRPVELPTHYVRQYAENIRLLLAQRRSGLSMAPVVSGRSWVYPPDYDLPRLVRTFDKLRGAV